MKYSKHIVGIVIIMAIVPLVLIWRKNECKDIINGDMKSKVKEMMEERSLEACRVFNKEEDIAKTECFLMRAIDQITEKRNEYINIADIDEFSRMMLLPCYLRLAYLYKCHENESAYRLIYNKFSDENIASSEEYLHGRTKQQFFEENLLLTAIGKNTVWNNSDRRLQDGAYALLIRDSAELFAEKLGIKISLKGNWKDFRGDLEDAIEREGLKNISDRAKATEKRDPFFSIKECPLSEMIEYSYLLKDSIVKLSLCLEKNPESVFISCSFFIIEMNPINHSDMKAQRDGAPSECPQG